MEKDEKLIYINFILITIIQIRALHLDKSFEELWLEIVLTITSKGKYQYEMILEIFEKKIYFSIFSSFLPIKN